MRSKGIVVAAIVAVVTDNRKRICFCLLVSFVERGAGFE